MYPSYRKAEVIARAKQDAQKLFSDHPALNTQDLQFYVVAMLATSEVTRRWQQVYSEAYVKTYQELQKEKNQQ